MNAHPIPANSNSAAEYFGSLIQKPRQGSFKVYVGRVPVGQLFNVILNEGRQLILSGIDVVVALDDNRSTADFPKSKIIPAKEIPLKEMKYKEVNYDEIQNLSPGLLIIDDLLHSNLAGVQPELRYKNVKKYLSQGISVISTIYGPWDDNLKTVLSYLGNGAMVPVERWAELPNDEVVALVFTPKEAFSHAELLSSN